MLISDNTLVAHERMSCSKVEKAGANVLFEEPDKRSNNIGVVVSPVRINSLQDFGSPQFVADKLINAEKRKVIKINKRDLQ